MTRIFTVDVDLSAADADGVCLAQAPSAAGSLNLNGILVSGGIATLDSNGFPRQLLFDCAGNQTGITYTIYGKLRAGGDVVTESLAGANATTTTSVNFWYQIVDIRNSAGLPGNVTIGTNEIGSSKPIVIDRYTNNPSTTFGFKTSGTVNYTLQYTANNVFNNNETPLWFDDATAAAKSADFGYPCSYTPGAFRVKINSGTGSVSTTVSPSGF